MSFKVPALAALGLFLASASICTATSVKATGKSDYGGSPNGSLTQDSSITPANLGGGFSAFIDNSFSFGSNSYLEIDTPGLLAGTIINISGLGPNAVFDAVYCAASSFIGTCDPSGALPLTTAQLNCLSTLSSSGPTAGVFQISAPGCTTTGSYTMALIFSNSDDSTFSASDLSTLSVSTTPPVGAPEPGSLMMLGAGLVGLLVRRRSGLAARS
jgi:hypothetical protein